MTTYLFIDGTNFYAGQYELFGPDKYLDFSKFIKSVERKLNITFTKIFFYASYTPRKKKMSKKEYAYITNEFLFYQSVKKTPRTTFFKGYRSKTSGKEKEVDVKLSVDFVGYGLLDKYDTTYLLTGDADFLQAAYFLKQYAPNKKIKLLCLGNKIMYKGLYALSSIIIDFKDKKLVRKQKIIRRNKFIYLEENKVINRV